MRRLAPALLVAALGGACGFDEGSVELAWAFVDRDGEAIFPGGAFSIDVERSTCGMPGLVGEQPIPYDLRVELSICDPECAAGCEADECQVIAPHSFACNSARGNLPAVPASDSPLRFTVRAVVSAPSIDVECRDVDPTCIAAPSPRDREVQAGLVTDLQVYQIAIDVDRDGDQTLDLEACGCA